MSSTTPLHLSSSSNRPATRATARQQLEASDSSTKRAQSKERNELLSDTKKRVKLKVSHPYETNLSMEEKAERVAIVLEPRQKCRYKEGCNRPALERNQGFCGSHCNSFIRNKGHSGGLCLAAEFMPKKGTRLCECESSLCFEIGYPTLGNFYAPTQTDDAENWLKAISASTELRKKSKTNQIRVAYWHFRPEDRDWNGSQWVLKNGALPVANLRLFVDSFLQPKRKAPSIRLPNMHSAGGTRRRLSFHSPVSILTDITNRTSSSTRPSEQERLQKRTSDLEVVVRNQEQVEVEKEASMKKVESKLKKVEKENAMLKIANEELTQKTTEETATLLELCEKTKEKSELEIEQLKSTFELRIDVMREKCKHLAAQKIEIERKHSEVLTEIKSAYERRIGMFEVQQMRAGAVGEALALPTPLRYANFLNGGHFSKYTRVFFNLPDMNSVEKFTDAINVKLHPDDPGVCTRLRRYSYVTRKVRAGNQEFIDGKKGLASSCENAKGGAPRKLDWKDEFLIFMTVLHAGWTYIQIEATFQVSDTMVSDIVHQYSVYLNKFLKMAMPNPTKEQVRRRYPVNFVEKYGHGRINMLLDCCDQEFEDPRFRSLHCVLYSSYHTQTGAKFGVGCTPIGTVPHPWCTDGYPSSVTDPNLVTASGIIANNLRRGDVVQVDKGFLIENECAKMGVQVSRPTTMRNKQRQQSRGDTEKTQMIGNTRIIIENINRQGKSENRYFHGALSITAKDIASNMMRIGFLFANFKPAFIHGKK